MANKQSQDSYGAQSIRVLEGLEAVRKRPGMYIGDTAERGLHHLVNEIVDNSVDEALAGYCDEINVVILSDNQISVEDNGRGIPVDMHPTEKRSALEVVHTVLHAGGKFDRGAYKVSGGLHGVGASVVNALSEEFEVEVRRDGKLYYQRYERGVPKTKVEERGATKLSGTKTTFSPDPKIFPEVKFKYETIARYLREMAYLNAGLKIRIKDERTGKNEEFHYEGGIAEFVESLTAGNESAARRDLFQGRARGYRRRSGAAMDRRRSRSDVHLRQQHPHRRGRHASVGTQVRADPHASTSTRSKNNLFKNKDMRLEGDDTREGLIAIISVKIARAAVRRPDQDQARQLRGRGDGRGAGQREARRVPRGKSRPTRSKIIGRADRGRHRPRGGAQGQGPGAAQGRARFRRRCRASWPTARNATPRAASCSSSRATRPAARPSRAAIARVQAILPLRGKILNVERARIDKVLVLERVAHADHGARDGRGRRKGSRASCAITTIVIMTDADVDGSHIRTLLLTFFFRQFIEIIENGYLYVAQPPLFRAKKGKQERYLKDEIALEDYLTDLGAEALTFQAGKGKDARELKGAALKTMVRKALQRDRMYEAARAALQGARDRRRRWPNWSPTSDASDESFRLRQGARRSWPRRSSRNWKG